LTPDQVKGTFATDLKQYLVIEVGVYPEAGHTIDLSASDFALRVGAQGDIVRAANPGAMAAANQRKHMPPPSRRSDVTLYPSATVGVATGTDPVTGRRAHGVYTDTGVGIGIGDQGMPAPPPPGSTDRDRDVMNQELADKTLPDGKTTEPVAGYVYFRLPPKARGSALELQYFGANGKLRVPLPALKIK